MTISSPVPGTVRVPRIPGGLETPCLLIDLDVVESNAVGMAKAAAERGVALRPHVKTHKSIALGRIQLAAGADGITVGTVGEAEVFATAGFDDVLIAYPVWAGGARGGRLRALHEAIGLRVGIDSVEGAAALAAAVRGAGRRLEVLVEIDSGGRRTGVAGPAEAVTVAEAADRAGLAVVGVFTHGGHSYAGPEAAAPAAADEVEALTVAAEALRAAGFAISTISAGSTPTRLLSATGAVNEVRPGTYLLGDHQQLVLGAIGGDEIAIHVAGTVVSRAVPGQFVLDTGAKSLTKDKAAYLPGFGFIPAMPDAVIERLSDYHAVVRLPEGIPPPAVGGVLAVVPNHACPVVDLFDSFLAHRSGEVVGEWPVDARGRSA